MQDAMIVPLKSGTIPKWRQIYVSDVVATAIVVQINEITSLVAGPSALLARYRTEALAKVSDCAVFG